MKSPYKFVLGQHVWVPDQDHVQGVVCLPSIINEKLQTVLCTASARLYFIRYHDDDGIEIEGWFVENELCHINPTPAEIEKQEETARIKLEGITRAKCLEEFAVHENQWALERKSLERRLARARSAARKVGIKRKKR